MHGLYTPSAAFFRNTTTLHKISPGRAKTLMGTIPDSRTLNPYVSFEERAVVKVSTSSKTAYRLRFTGIIGYALAHDHTAPETCYHFS